MSFLGKIMDTMRLNDDEDDDYFLDDDYEDEKSFRCAAEAGWRFL